MSARLTGLIAAPFTPMREDGAVWLEQIEVQAAALAASGVSGGFVCGSTGESLSLTVPERKQVTERWVASAPDGLAVIAHVGHNCLAESQALAAHAQEAGAAAIGAMPPCFFKPATLDALVDWCAAVAAAAPDLPFYYYHIPSMTGVDIFVAELLEAAADRIPTLAGVKFTYENLLDFSRCVQLGGGRFNMLFGRDEILLAGLALGADGAVGSTYNFSAPLYLRIIEAFEAGDIAAARAAQARAGEIIVALLKYGGMPAFKAVMAMIGVDCGPVRPPLRPLTPERSRSLRTDLERLGFFDDCNRRPGP